MTRSQNWDGIGITVDLYSTSSYSCLFSDTISGKLIIGGNHIYSNGIDYGGIATWNDSILIALSGINGGIDYQILGDNDGIVLDIIRYHDEIYACGVFLIAGNDTVNNIAKFDGSNWQPIKKGIDGVVNRLYIWNDTLYVGGVFTSVNNGEILCNGIVKCDGNAYYNVPLIEPISNTIAIYSITSFQGCIFVGGNFSLNQNDLNVARLNGNQWESVGGGIHGGTDFVESMSVYNNELYIAGLFSLAHGNIGNFIQKWDGNVWKDVGGGVTGNTPQSNGQIHDLLVYQNYLWAVGVFKNAGGVPAKYIARWDGQNWCGFGSDFDNVIGVLGAFQNDLYIAGGFKQVDNNQNIKYIAKWIGGDFVDTCSTLSIENDLISNENSIMLFPNPTHTSVNFDISIILVNATLKLTDFIGKEIRMYKNLNGQKFSINIAELPPGIYLYSICEERQLVGKGKFVIE